MGHRNARLAVHGRRLLVERVRFEGMPAAHAAKAMGISRQCALPFPNLASPYAGITSRVTDTSISL